MSKILVELQKVAKHFQESMKRDGFAVHVSPASVAHAATA